MIEMSVLYLPQRSSRNYLRGFEAAGRLSISSHLLSRITGTVFVSKSKEGRNQAQRSNIGLNLKFNKTAKEVRVLSSSLRDVFRSTYSLLMPCCPFLCSLIHPSKLVHVNRCPGTPRRRIMSGSIRIALLRSLRNMSESKLYPNIL